MKKCPHCAEEILEAASRCKHCRSDLQSAVPRWFAGLGFLVSALALGLLLLQRAGAALRPPAAPAGTSLAAGACPLPDGAGLPTAVIPLPPGHPPIGDLPPGHPPLQLLPPGHPPVELLPDALVFSQDVVRDL